MAHQEGKELPLSDVLRYGVDLAKGVLELHGRGIMLFYLNPCIFLLDKNDQAVVRLSLPCLDVIQRVGTPNYMAPEQWKLNLNDLLSDSWAFGCSVVEMLSGVQPWCGRSPEEIYCLVAEKREKPLNDILFGLPWKLQDILCGCFEYSFEDRPSIKYILQEFESCKRAICGESDENDQMAEMSSYVHYTDWSLLMDQFQVGDTVCSRKLKISHKPASMKIPEGTVVGMETDGFVLVRVRRILNPLRAHCSMVERVSFGFAAGDWVRVTNEDNERSPVGILHSIERDGRVAANFIGMETLWNGHCSELQLAEPYFVGQFLRVKSSISTPRFEWPRKHGGKWATGRIYDIHPNGCLMVKFPGIFRLSFGEGCSFLADPAVVELVSFEKSKGLVKKYQHLEDFHWAVRPLVIALGLFTAMKLGIFIGKVRKERTASGSNRQTNSSWDKQNGTDPAWLPRSPANILFGEGCRTTPR